MANHKHKMDKSSFELTKGTLPSLKKETYDWEKKDGFHFEPWHLTTVSLILHSLILLMYFFVNAFIDYQLMLGYIGIGISILCIVISMFMLKRKTWPIGTTKFTKLINHVAIGVTLAVAFISFLLTPIG